MNIFGTKIYTNTGRQTLRTVGLGTVLLHGRANYGIDLLVSEDGTVDFSFGIDFIPSNDIRLNLGYNKLLNAKTVGVQYKSFSFCYCKNERLGESYFTGFELKF